MALTNLCLKALITAGSKFNLIKHKNPALCKSKQDDGLTQWCWRNTNQTPLTPNHGLPSPVPNTLSKNIDRGIVISTFFYIPTRNMELWAIHWPMRFQKVFRKMAARISESRSSAGVSSISAQATILPAYAHAWEWFTSEDGSWWAIAAWYLPALPQPR